MMYYSLTFSTIFSWTRLFLFVLPLYSQSQSITIDSSFNGTGRVVTDIHDTVLENIRYMNTSTLALQDDGKIVIGGTKIDSQVISRYNTNGTVDSSFGLNGIAAVFKNSQGGPSRIRILPNGKILVLSSEEAGARYCFYRYLSNGKLDVTFGQDGRKIFDLPS